MALSITISGTIIADPIGGASARRIEQDFLDQLAGVVNRFYKNGLSAATLTGDHTTYTTASSICSVATSSI
jgi:hypothetical protein